MRLRAEVHAFVSMAFIQGYQLELSSFDPTV